MKKIYYLFFILLIQAGYLPAQSFITKGNDFWLAFPYNTSGNSNMQIRITSDVSASGVLTSGLGLNVPFTVSPGSPFSYTVPSTHTISANQTFESKGIHITTSDSVNVYATSMATGGGDGICVLPTATLGNSYRIINYRNLNPTNILIVGTQNSTTLTITPSVTTLGGNGAGTPFNVVINQGQTYMVKANADVTGSVVTSDKPVNVLPNCQCSQVPSGASYCDFIWSQAVPINFWGTEYVTGYLAGRDNWDTYRILAHTSGTSVYINGALVTTLNAGQYYETTRTGGNWITSNNPINVNQFAESKSASGNIAGDPAMIQLIPTTVFGTSYRFTTPTFAMTNYVTMYSKTANTGLVRLNGIPPAGSWLPCGASGWSFLTTSIGSGEYTLSSDSACGGVVYGWASVTSYGYFIGASEPLIVVLPTEGLELNGTFEKEQLYLSWTVEHPEKYTEYTIQVLEEGSFKSKVSIPSSGSEYRKLYTHVKPGQAMQFRIAAETTDGETDYSNIIHIQIPGSFKPAEIYPVPSNQQETMLRIVSDQSQEIQIRLMSIDGKLLGSTKVEADASSNEYAVEKLFDLKEPGIYFIELTGSEIRETLKLIKE